MNEKISVCVICAEAIIFLWNLHNCTFEILSLPRYLFSFLILTIVAATNHKRKRCLFGWADISKSGHEQAGIVSTLTKSENRNTSYEQYAGNG